MYFVKDYCYICDKYPSSHSFSYLCDRELKNIREVVFYTRVADASRYNDKEGILSHYENLLKLSVGDKDKWVWIFDCDGFGLKHSLEISIAIAIGIARLINRFGKVSKILVINSNSFINFVLSVVKYFLEEEIYNKITLIKTEEKLKYNLELLKLSIVKSNFSVLNRY